MATKGPIPKPPEQLASWRGDPKRKGSSAYKTPKPKKGSPPMPDLTEDARAVWLETLPLLEQMRVVTKADRGVLQQYCETKALWAKSCKSINENGISREKDGRSYLSPEYRAFKDMSPELQRLSNLLGLNPSARTRIQVKPEEPTDRKNAATRKKFKGLAPEET